LCTTAKFGVDWQVWVSSGSRRLGPYVSFRQALGQIVAAIGDQAAVGREKSIRVDGRQPDGLPKACEALLSMLAEGYGLKTLRFRADMLVSADAIYFSPIQAEYPIAWTLVQYRPFSHE
jgi:hypothetical protein